MTMKTTTSRAHVPTSTSRAIVPALLVGIIVFYALSWVWSADVLASASPLWSVAIRLSASLVAVLVMNMAGSGFAKTGAQATAQVGLLPILMLSLLGFGGFFGLTYVALGMIPASLLVLVLSTIPILTLIQGRVLFGTRIAPLQLAGILCIAGAIILFARQTGPVGDNVALVGIGCGLFAAIGYSFYGLLYKKWASQVAVLDLLPWLLAPSAFAFAALGFVIEGAPLIAAADIAALAIIGALIAAPVYVMYNALILRAGPLTASSISVAAPITTFILESVMIRHHTLGPAAFTLVLVGATGVALLMLDGQRKDLKK